MLNIAVDEVGDLSADSDLDRSHPRRAELRSLGADRRGPRVHGHPRNTGGMGIIDTDKAVLCCIDSFRRLADLGVKHGVSILIENHGGLSADPDHIVQIVNEVRLTHGDTVIGTLPDFGNWPDSVDRFASLAEIMPLAKAVHVKV